MQRPRPQNVCWQPIWNSAFPGIGMEHVALADGSADSVLLGVSEQGIAFRLLYQLRWDERGHVRSAQLQSREGDRMRSLTLIADGAGGWQNAAGDPLRALDGCIDVDIWPTPLTNSLPIWRHEWQFGERREFLMAWISAPELTVEAKAQAYTRLSPTSYRFESLDGSGFTAELEVDASGIVRDYPGLFRRVELSAN